MPRLKACPKNEQLAEKRSFEGNCEMLRSYDGILIIHSRKIVQLEKKYLLSNVELSLYFEFAKINEFPRFSFVSRCLYLGISFVIGQNK